MSKMHEQNEDSSHLGSSVLELTGHVMLTLAKWNQALSTLEVSVIMFVCI